MEKIYNGTTISFEFNSANYPASEGYTASVVYRGSTSYYSFNTTNNGSNYKLEVSPSQNNIPPGKYLILYEFSKSGNIYVEEADWVQVLPSPKSVTDNRTHEEKVLDAINAVLESRATKEHLSYSIGGRSLALMTFDELIKAKSYYEALVKMQRGEFKYNIKVKFI